MEIYEVYVVYHLQDGGQVPARVSRRHSPGGEPRVGGIKMPREGLQAGGEG